MAGPLIASNLAHFVGDMQDDLVPVVILYEHDERGPQYLEAARIFQRDGRLVIEAGRLVGEPKATE